MKKRLSQHILVLLLWTLLTGALAPVLSRTPKSVRADAPPAQGTYACILEENTFLYATADESQGLFLLPTTYYVKLLEYGESYSKVEYLYDGEKVKKQLGYVKTELLTFVDYQPVQPYFYHTFTLRYKIEEQTVSDSSFLSELAVDCTYYGDYKIGSKTYCYVLRAGEFGYVPKPADLTVTKNGEYEDYLAAQSSSSEESVQEPEPEPTEAKSSPAQIAILIALCLLVPVLSALILKPPRKPPYELDGD